MKQPSLADQVKELSIEADLAQNRIIAANAQLADLQKRTQQLDFEFKAETLRLRKQQSSLLAQDKQKALTELDEIKKRRAIEREAVVIAHEQMLKYSQKGRLLTIKIQNIQKDVDILTIDRETLVSRINNIKSDINSENRRLLAIKAETEVVFQTKTVLELQVIELTDKIPELETEEERLLGEIVSLNKEYSAIKLKNQTGEDDITDRIRIKKIELRELQKYENETRQDLANRKLDLDEQEKVIRIRERKVASQEATIVQNAGLLEL